MNGMRSAFVKELPFFLVLPALLWQLIFFCIPLFFIVLFSFLPTAQVTQETYFTLQNYRTLFDLQFLHIIGRSLCVAFITSCLCALFAYPLAYHIAFNVQQRWRNPLLFFFMLPFWTNLLVQVYSWFFVLEKYGLINSVLLKYGLISTPLPLLNSTFAIYLVMFYCYLPFMVMPLYSSLEKFDTRLFEASADLGARPWQTFLKVTLPLSVPGIRTGFFLVFVPSFGEFVIPALMGGGKHLYVGTLISHYFLVARSTPLGAAFTCLMGLILIGAVVFLYYGIARLFLGQPR